MSEHHQTPALLASTLTRSAIMAALISMNAVIADELQMLPNPQNELFQRSRVIQSTMDEVGFSVPDNNDEKGGWNVTCHQSWSRVITEADQIRNAEFAVKNYLREYGLYSLEGQKDWVERREITEQEAEQSGMPFLSKQFGIFSVEDVPMYTVIGQYFGDEYNSSEITTDMPGYHTKKKYFLTVNWNHYGPKASQITRNITFKTDAYFMDPLDEQKVDLQKTVMVAFVNDARKDISQGNLSEDDRRERLNSDFIYCSVNNAVFTFLVTIKPIPENTQLFNYYGSGYNRTRLTKTTNNNDDDDDEDDGVSVVSLIPVIVGVLISSLFSLL